MEIDVKVTWMRRKGETPQRSSCGRACYNKTLWFLKKTATIICHKNNSRDLQEPSRERTMSPLSEEMICWVEFGLHPSEAPVGTAQWRACSNIPDKTPGPHDSLPPSSGSSLSEWGDGSPETFRFWMEDCRRHQDRGDVFISSSSWKLCIWKRKEDMGLDH